MIDDFKSRDSDPITTWDRVLLVIALIAALSVLSIKDADAEWSASMAKGSMRIPGPIVVSHTVR